MYIRRTVDELATNFAQVSDHSCRSSCDFNLRLVSDMQQCLCGLDNVKLKVIYLKMLILK